MNYDEQASLLLHEGVVMSDNGDSIGRVGQVFTDNETGRPTWVTTRTGFFGTRESFVPLDDAVIVGEQVRVPYDRDLIRGAPHYEIGDDLTEEQENELHAYYGFTDGTGLSADGRQGRDDGVDVIRSAEQLQVQTRRVQTRRARLHKFVVTEQQTVTVPVTHDEVRLIREPITDENRNEILASIDVAETEFEVVLTEDRVLVDKTVVPVERVSLGTETVTEEQPVSAPVRTEQVELHTEAPAPAGSTTNDRRES